MVKQKSCDIPKSKFKEKNSLKNRKQWDDSISDLTSYKPTKNDLERRKIMSQSTNLNLASRELNRPKNLKDLDTSTATVLEKAQEFFNTFKNENTNLNSRNNFNLNSATNIQDMITTTSQNTINSLNLAENSSNSSPQTSKTILYPAKMTNITFAPDFSNENSSKITEMKDSQNTMNFLNPDLNFQKFLNLDQNNLQNFTKNSQTSVDAKNQNQNQSHEYDFLIKAISQLVEKVGILYTQLETEKSKREILECKVDWMSKRINLLENNKIKEIKNENGNGLTIPKQVNNAKTFKRNLTSFNIRTDQCLNTK